MPQRYRATMRFQRIETVDSGRQDIADPVWLQVLVTPSDDLHEVVESFTLPGSNPNGVTPTANTPFRLFTGAWAVDLNPGLYEDGKTYTVHWRFGMMPDVLNVTRTNFVWRGIPAPRSGGCILHGVVEANKVPVGNARVIVEQYADWITLTRRLSSVTLNTDAFGVWWVEVDKNSVQRVISTAGGVPILVGSTDTLDIEDARRWRSSDVLKDSFGYPMPSGQATEQPELAGLNDCGLSTPDTVLPTQPEPTTPKPGEACPCRYTHTQGTPATTWVIEHNLHGNPSITIVDDTGETVVGDVAYTSLDTMEVTFVIPLAGYAYLD